MVVGVKYIYMLPVSVPSEGCMIIRPRLVMLGGIVGESRGQIWGYRDRQLGKLLTLVQSCS